MNQFGPLIEKNGVRFRLWAPDADKVFLEVDGHGILPLTPKENGWKEAFVACDIGTPYRFLIGETTFPDPASRRQRGGVHGWSILLEPFQPDPRWKGRPWEETVFYECHAGQMGGYEGISRKLKSLKDLGISAIELMPIAAFPGTRNWGYDGVLPFAPSEAYGTTQELKCLIERVHELGLTIFLDVVYNHFGPDGNYLPLFAAKFFRNDQNTPWGSAIDFRVPEVRRFFFENTCYWLFEFGFDGLRFDAVHTITDEGWFEESAKALRSRAADRHVHLVLENENNAARYLRRGFNAQWNDDFHHALHVLLTGETIGYYADYAKGTTTCLARALSDGFIYQGQPSIHRQGRTRGELSSDLPPSAFVAFLQNHDQIGNRPFGERLISISQPAALKAAVALLLLMPQIPLIFMGEEIGTGSPFVYFTDHEPSLAKLVQEGREREFSQFPRRKAGEWLPDPNALSTFCMCDPERNAPESDDWSALYRNLLALRIKLVSPFLKCARSIEARATSPCSVIASWDLGPGGRLTIASNLGTSAVQARLPTAETIWGSAPVSNAIPCTTTLAWIERSEA